MGAADENGGGFKFLRNGDTEPVGLDWNKGIESARQAISEAMSAKNIAFLLGAGCSSLAKAGKQVGIPTMASLAQEFCGETIAARAAGYYSEPSVPDRASEPTPDLGAIEGAAVDDPEPAAKEATHYVIRGEDGADKLLASPGEDPVPAEAEPAAWRLTLDEINLLESLGVDLERNYNRNLERLMEVLYGQRFVLQQSSNASHWPQRDVIGGIIKKVQEYLWAKVTDGAFAHGDSSVLTIYESFYKRLVLRDRSLPRPWIFTTNYDMFNETAMDRLGIPYANGFSGVVERRFNPASFRYALAEQLDVGNRKWSAVDAFVYLCKLHGSVSWTEDDHGLFPIREVWPPLDATRMLIYPTPAKQNASLGSPYADLFREFQSRVVREQSVLITAGYAFGDEHLNNIIYQALTIPTFRLIIFASPDSLGEIAKLRALRDPRIWIIGGDGPTVGTQAHHFDSIVENFLPQRPSERIDEAVRKVLHNMAVVSQDDD